jgi:hypothetical protein
MSTISVALAEQLAKEHEQRGLALVCAPVMGRPDAAVAAKLFILGRRSGSGESIDVSPCSTRWGSGPSGSELSRVRGGREAVGEFSDRGAHRELVGSIGARHQARREHAHARRSAHEHVVLRAGVQDLRGAIVADQRYRPRDFRPPLGLKDMSLVLDAARGANAPMPLGSLIRDHLIAAMALGYARRRLEFPGSGGSAQCGMR